MSGGYYPPRSDPYEQQIWKQIEEDEAVEAALEAARTRGTVRREIRHSAGEARRGLDIQEVLKEDSVRGPLE